MSKYNALGVSVVVIVLSVTTVVFLSGCGKPRQSQEHGVELRNHRQYDQAKAVFQGLLQKQPENIELWTEMARTCLEAQEWDSSEVWWQKILEQNADDPEALKGLWRSQWEGADSTSKAEIGNAIVERLDHLVPASEDRLGILSLAVDVYGIIDDSVRQADFQDRLIDQFPQSKEAYDIIGERFYDGLYPIWQDNKAQIDYLIEFAHRYQKTTWRRTAYSWLLYDLHDIGKLDTMYVFCKILSKEFSDDPFALATASRWLLKAERDLPLAMEYAMDAVNLERTVQRPEHYPPEQWQLEKAGLYGNSRLIVAQIYQKQDSLLHAEKWLRTAISESPYTVDDDKNSAAHWAVLSEVFMATERYDEAIDAAVRCLVEGDRRNKWGSLADSMLIEGCKYTGHDPETRLQLARELVDYQGPIFTEVTELAGLADRKESRVAWGDVDNDGDDDILLSGRVLFVNQGDGTFTDGTEAAGIAGSANGGVFGDYDNDGWLDFYATSSGTGDKADRLWRNRGDGTFEDVTTAAGNVCDDVSTEGAAWGDLNGDGFLDLYVANYEKPGKDLGQGTADRFYLNQGDGTFKEVAESIGIIPPFGRHLCGRGVNWGDYDNNGDQDIFVSNYRLQENLLWRNQGDGNVINTALIAGVAGVEVEGWWGHTIGSEWGDYDNDGDLDLITANLAHPRYLDFSNKTCLYENQGAPDYTFVNRRSEAGIKYDETHSDPAWGDVDNDGFLDLYLTCIYQNMRSFLYHNQGDGTFKEITYLSGTRAFNGWGCAFSDYDNDGDLDLCVASGSGVKLFRNDSPAKHWLQVKAVGTQSNHASIGARIEIRQGKFRQIREVQGGHGTTSQHSLVAHFGLGNRDDPVTVTVRFPSGTTRVVENTTVDQRIEVVE